jgi:HPt (histidine-containing phosphotransfer) domain-containing protein
MLRGYPKKEGIAKPLFDQAALLERVSGDDDFAQKLIETNITDISGKIEEIDACIKSNDMVTAHRRAHGIMGSAASIGALHLSTVAWRIEKASTAPDRAGHGGCLKDLKRQ